MTILIKKGIIISVLVLTAALMGGCSTRADEAAFLSFRESLAAAGRVEAEARVVSSAGGEAAEYVLMAESAGGETIVTVKEPVCIAGVRAAMSPDGDALEFEGVTLAVPTLTAGGLTPVSALPMLIEAMEQGHVESVWRGDGELAIELASSDTERLTVFFSPDFAPVRAEFTNADTGESVIAMEITEFHTES